MFPLYLYQQKHPLNFLFLGLFTLCLSLSVGVACANTQGENCLLCRHIDIILVQCLLRSTFHSYFFFLFYKNIFFPGRIVLEALILTSAVVASLTGYTFWASKKGKDFSYLGPILFAGLLVLLLTSFIQVHFDQRLQFCLVIWNCSICF